MPTSVYLLPLHNDNKNDEGEDDEYQHDDKSDDGHAEPRGGWGDDVGDVANLGGIEVQVANLDLNRTLTSHPHDLDTTLTGHPHDLDTTLTSHPHDVYRTLTSHPHGVDRMTSHPHDVDRP